VKRIVVDQSFPDKLAGIAGPVELCDAAGHVFGVYTPNPDAFDNYEPPLSEEEARRLEAEPGGRPLADILADWGRRG
jgi:hypothetical protein